MAREAEAETVNSGPPEMTSDMTSESPSLSQLPHLSQPSPQTPPPPPPPLPPRQRPSVDGSAQVSLAPPSKPTTAVTPIDISTLSFPDGTRGTFSTSAARAASTPGASGYATPSRDFAAGGDLADSMSVMSFAPTMRPHGDLASLVAGGLNRKSRAWNMLRSQAETVQPFERIVLGIPGDLAGFEREFDEIPDGPADDVRLAIWKSKLKHYMILSSAGKPIYSRHGDLSLINSYMGVVQTIISFYEGANNPLLGFTAGDARFVIAIEGPLYFVAISKLRESDAQLRSQLDALYMQILSTLTLPTLKNIFVHRPSTDLRKPLEGTESLLSSLADSFTRGSPSTLLGALECLRLRKSQRHAINNLFLKSRSDKLLYGLIVAGGKLVSVIRPRKHSLHPSDLQLIFNMLFESGGIKAGGGESWIPLCLPAFNNRGYLYMYVSFFDGEELPSYQQSPGSANANTNNRPEAEAEIALVLISPDKESFFDLQEMRDKLAAQLTKTGHLALIRSAAREGRPRIQTVAPGAQISHFLYKSRANVQFCMSPLELAASVSEPPPPTPPGTEPTSTSTSIAPLPPSSGPESMLTRRRLMTLYHELHAALHAKHAHLKVLHAVGEDAASLAWVTPVLEFYCVAGPNVSRAAMAQAANRVIQWAKREEERLFIIGGGVF
ncbi:trafficking protein Mon1-domain-containing protein [Staphylotrichum tortipilum]|uniref:Vacuolar fusion protein MON1 n=1 Tax=Staphylotrichum tortipilum TaxID=2831512 RepID=A0AAN6MVE4_9PEZI|nr:trafficking protein Mon1-domain-containing protein [Staphylotrichum longicolle]